MSPDEEIVRGNEARMLMQNKLYLESWQAIEQRLVSLLKQIDIDPAKEERVKWTLKGLELYRRHLESVMQTGKMAAQQIERDKTFAERVGDRIRSVA